MGNRTAKIALFFIINFFSCNVFADVKLLLTPYRYFDTSQDLVISSETYLTDRLGNIFVVRNGKRLPQPGQAVCSLLLLRSDEALEAMLDNSFSHYAGDSSVSTFCQTLLPDQKGGFFLRGVFLRDEKVIDGFILSVDSHLKRQWVFFDRQVVNWKGMLHHKSYYGEYSTSLPQLAYSPQLSQLVAFTQSLFSGGETQFKQRVTQLYTLDTHTGSLVNPSLLVTSGSSNHLQNSYWLGEPFASYLFALDNRHSKSLRLFSYDADLLLEPVTLPPSWSDRVILQLLVSDERLLVFWEKGSLQPMDKPKVSNELERNGVSNYNASHLSILEFRSTDPSRGKGKRLGITEEREILLPKLFRASWDWRTFYLSMFTKALIARDDGVILSYTPMREWVVESFLLSGKVQGISVISKMGGSLKHSEGLEWSDGYTPDEEEVFTDLFEAKSGEDYYFFVTKNVSSQQRKIYKMKIRDLPDYDPNELPLAAKEKISAELSRGCCATTPLGYDSGSFLLLIVGLLLARKMRRRGG